MSTTTNNQTPVILAGTGNGLTVIPQPTPLTRLNYFDGKFLRASDFAKEQDYVRALVRHSNQAGGVGVVHGLEAFLMTTGGAISVCPGMAIDPAGDVILLPNKVLLDVAKLIAASQASQAAATPTASATGAAGFDPCTPVVVTPPTPGQVSPGADLYLLIVSPASAYCGQEDVYGKICENACVTSTAYSSIVEGALFQLVPLVLKTALKTSKSIILGSEHFRSRVASAYYADEALNVASIIASGDLKSALWCHGAELAGGSGVPLGILAMAGSTPTFLDAWSARRERIDVPARRYWAWRMSMRPWDVYLAQILQFQCQLGQLLAALPTLVEPSTPELVAAPINDALVLVTQLKTEYMKLVGQNFGDSGVAFDAVKAFSDVESKLATAKDGLVKPLTKNILPQGGIVELPPAGYLPVAPGSTETVNDQVRRLLGEGVDLRFCVVRPDFVPHALEEAQHMERICLLQGLDDPSNKPQVDILVPNGKIKSISTVETTKAYELATVFSSSAAGTPATTPGALHGVARAEALSGTGRALHAAAITPGASPVPFSGYQAIVQLCTVLTGSGPESIPINLDGVGETGLFPITNFVALGGQLMWATMQADDDPFALAENASTSLTGRIFTAATSVGAASGQAVVTFMSFQGEMVVSSRSEPSAGEILVTAQLLATTTFQFGMGDSEQKFCANRGGELTLHRKVVGSKGAFVAQLQVGDGDNSTPLAVQVKWGATGKPALGGVLIDNEPIATASFALNSDVLRVGNWHHDLAAQAITSLGTTLGDSGNFFKTLAEQDLFPPISPAVTELLVQSTENWVLFHRRRTKSCGEVTSAIVAPKPTTYKVFYVPATANTTPAALSAALTAGASWDVLPSPVEIATIAFQAKTSTLDTSADAISAAWQAANPGNYLQLGVIATTGSADAPSTEQERVSKVLAPLSTTTEVAGAQTLVLASAPPGAPLGTADGVILLVVENLRCHHVFRIAVSSPEALAQVTTAIEAGATTSLLAMAAPAGTASPSSMLATIGFDLGKSQVTEIAAAQLFNAWAQASGGALAMVGVLARAGVAAESAAIQVARSTAIAHVVDASFSGVTQAQGPIDEAPWLSISRLSPLKCPALTFLVTSPGGVQVMLGALVVTIQVFSGQFAADDLVSLALEGQLLGNPDIGIETIDTDSQIFFVNDVLDNASETTLKDIAVNFLGPNSNFGPWVGLALASNNGEGSPENRLSQVRDALLTNGVPNEDFFADAGPLKGQLLQMAQEMGFDEAVLIILNPQG